MSRFLLDTHALLWWLFDDPRLIDSSRHLIRDPANEILVSAASAWEICTKHRLGKLTVAAELARDVPGWVARAGFRELHVTMIHAQKAGGWPQPHRDPFDRMLAAQSFFEGIPLISKDSKIDVFGIQRIW